MLFSTTKYRSNKTELFLYDDGYKDLIKTSRQTPKVVKRSKEQIITYYQGVEKDGTIKFMTPSGTTPGLYWNQRIKLVDLKKLIQRFGDKKKPKDIVTLAIKGNLKVSCNDPSGGDEPSWLYWGYKYKATRKGYNEGSPETRFPEVRNPKLKGSVCKHLRACLENISFHIGLITRDLKKKGFFNHD